MPDDENLLLKELLAEARVLREQIGDVQREMMRKDDFIRAQAQVDAKLASVEQTQREHGTQLVMLGRFQSGVTWFMRVVAVAILGMLITLATQNIHLDFGNMAKAVPLNIPTPVSGHR